ARTRLAGAARREPHGPAAQGGVGRGVVRGAVPERVHSLPHGGGAQGRRRLPGEGEGPAGGGPRGELGAAGAGGGSVQSLIAVFTVSCSGGERETVNKGGLSMMRCNYSCGSADHNLSRRAFLGGVAGAVGGLAFAPLRAAQQLQTAHKRVVVIFLA